MALGWVDAVEPANEGDVRGSVRVVLDPLDDADGGSGVSFEIDGSLQALGSAASVEGSYAALGVSAGGLGGSEGELSQGSLHYCHRSLFSTLTRAHCYFIDLKVNTN